MEIERKFLIRKFPDNLDAYEHARIEQGYLCTSPVVRVRRDGDSYYMTYKGSGLMAREEYNLALDPGSYAHLIAKADGTVITKTRYRIPLENSLVAELDIFDGILKGIVMAEVEFESIEAAKSFAPPDWFGEDVTNDVRYHNSNMSKGIVPKPC